VTGSSAGEAVRRITPVILSGGSGTRLWPLSRKARPKQLLGLTGERTMLQLTADRVADSALFGEPVVVTAAGHAEAIEAQLGAGVRLILEPAGRNTAPAIALAALAAPSDALLLVMPSDHLIAEPARFVDAVRAGIAAAEEGWLVTFGVRPTRPETGFGYIRRGEPLAPGVFRAERFLEKPDAATAAAFLADGGYDWNGGIFLFTAGAILDSLAEHAPDILEAVRAAVPGNAGADRRLAPSAEAFARVPAQAIDRAVMERAGRVAVVPFDGGWSDLGSWEALHAASAADEAGNVLSGDVEALSASGCLVRSEGTLVVAIGVADLAIVATPDAVLVVPLSQTQAVADAVRLLAERGKPET
jgi:mannose-1-phosphate guanylyltransferase/mannose-1-phosphate guanylyltransferase/mannose-6-phosphate isomerase